VLIARVVMVVVVVVLLLLLLLGMVMVVAEWMAKAVRRRRGRLVKWQWE
jgi:hypothetical protein